MTAPDFMAGGKGKAVTIAIATVQWILLTVALGAMIIYTDRSLEGLLGWRLDSGYAFFGAMVIGGLQGVTIERAKALIPMVILSCLTAAGIYAALLFYPVWTGNLVQTVGLENFATTRAMLYFGLAIIPVSLGAMAGRLLGSSLPGGNLLSRSSDRETTRWWLDRNQPEDAQRESL